MKMQSLASTLKSLWNKKMEIYFYKERFYHTCLDFCRKNRPVLTLSLNIPAQVYNQSSSSKKQLFDNLFRCLKAFVSNELAMDTPFIQDNHLWFKCAAWSVNGDPVFYKALCILAERTFPAFRLVDLDVLKSDGTFISRSWFKLPEQTCFVCSNPVTLCRREMKHSLDQIANAVFNLTRRLIQGLSPNSTRGLENRLSLLTGRALLEELCLTPKPGLVDLGPRSAHTDMDVHDFFNSIFNIAPLMGNFFTLGHDWAGGAGFFDLRDHIKGHGIHLESLMNKATNGVNTHKGAIFIFGVVLSVMGYMKYYDLFRQKDGSFFLSISEQIKALFGPAMKTEITGLARKNGISPARHSALNGYPEIIQAQNIYQDILNHSARHRCALYAVLAFFGMSLEDSNIIRRSSKETLEFSKNIFSQVLSKIYKNPGQCFNLMEQADILHCNRDISPGGAADMLGLFSFIYNLDKRGNLCKSY